MGFAIYYRSTRSVTPKEAVAIGRTSEKLVRGHTWLSCEPVHISQQEDGYLEGGSKPNFEPDPGDAAAAAEERLPDGTTQDLLDILCELSRVHHIDWEISHDYSGGPFGYIRNGISEREVQNVISTFANLSGMLDEYLPQFEDGPASLPKSASDHRKRYTGDDDDDDGPPILKFRPRE